MIIRDFRDEIKFWNRVDFSLTAIDGDLAIIHGDRGWVGHLAWSSIRLAWLPTLPRLLSLNTAVPYTFIVRTLLWYWVKLAWVFDINFTKVYTLISVFKASIIAFVTLKSLIVLWVGSNRQLILHCLPENVLRPAWAETNSFKELTFWDVVHGIWEKLHTIYICSSIEVDGALWGQKLIHTPLKHRHLDKLAACRPFFRFWC